MSKMKFLSVFFFLISFIMIAQESLNEYKYIIVPSQYGFQKAEDSYQLNSLTKFLFNKAGFTSVLSTDNFPDDLEKNKCLALTAKLKNKSSMFTTKMSFDLVNCNSTVVFSSKEATSKKKDYKKAYHEVVRKTFEDIKARNYKYAPKKEEVSVAIKEKEINDEVIIAKEDNKFVRPTIKEDLNLLYAQPVKNGFQLVDSTPKRVYTIQHTSVKDVFILKDKSGILYKQNNDWIIEYYSDNQLIKKKVNIKF